MHAYRFALLAALLLLFVLPVDAQTRFGVGIRFTEHDNFDAIRPDSVFASDFIDIIPDPIIFTLSIDMLGVRLEPEFGIARVSETVSFGSAPPGGPVTFTSMHRLFGLGVFGYREPAERIRALYGVRVRYSAVERKNVDRVFDGPQDSILRGGIFTAGPFVGIEANLLSRLAIGAEAGVVYSRYSGDFFAGVEREAPAIGTQIGFSARFFF